MPHHVGSYNILPPWPWSPRFTALSSRVYIVIYYTHGRYTDRDTQTYVGVGLCPRLRWLRLVTWKARGGGRAPGSENHCYCSAEYTHSDSDKIARRKQCEFQFSRLARAIRCTCKVDNNTATSELKTAPEVRAVIQIMAQQTTFWTVDRYRIPIHRLSSKINIQLHYLILLFVIF